MNWVDGILIVLLLGSVIVGSKKGLIRELMAFFIFFASIVVCFNYADHFSVWVFEKVGGSPLSSAFLSFVLLLALAYTVFKISGLLFYKIANIKGSGRRDQLGGALVGFFRGWIGVGFLTFLVFLMPVMPDAFYDEFEESFFGPTIAKTVPLMFEGTAKLHPNNVDFMDQIEKTLMLNNRNGNSGEILNSDKVEIYKVLYRLEKFFTTRLETN